MAENLQFEIAFCESVLRQLPQDADIMEMLAGYYTRAGRIDDGLQMDERLVELCPGNATHHYNLACSLALAGRKDAAVERLRVALQKGYSDYEWMLRDEDLQGLKGFPPFINLLAEFEIRR
ncbi:MAG: tetratricopeptide repeat protein [Verrucomicrobiota bacterium JB022]|nr:tetratricopeptide repeat protein [Verrucomicrobiota bacterium JB022]